MLTYYRAMKQLNNKQNSFLLHHKRTRITNSENNTRTKSSLCSSEQCTTATVTHQQTQSEMLGTNAVRLENVQPYHIFTLSYRLAGVQWHLAQRACIMPLSFQIGKCLDSGDINNLSVYMSQQLPLVIVFFCFNKNIPSEFWNEIMVHRHQNI